MTAIAGWIQGRDVWLGADSAATGGLSQEIWRTPKVFVREGIGVAYTWSWRFGQLLHHRLQVPKRPGRARDVDRWVTVDLVDAIRKCLADGGWLKKEHERVEGGAALLAIRGRLFVLQSDFSVGEIRGRFAAHGCGRDLLYGALHATTSLRWTPERRLRVALAAAAHFSAGVASPFRILRIAGKP